MAEKRAVLIAGPTASGKSAWALARARLTGGVIVNADAMQMYSGLRVLTARPGDEDLGTAPHLLYGTIDPGVRFSTGQWFDAARTLLGQEAGQGREVIFVGGTGLYFEALINGIANVPAVPAEVVAEVTVEVDKLSREGRRALLEARDPEMAARLAEPDRQRLIRALSVKAATGRSLASFVADGQAGLLDGFAVERLVLAPERAVLRERIARRFDAMMEQGAVDEVAALIARGLDPSLPAMKAIGVREVADWQAGRLSREAAVTLAVNASRQYAKRQMTWFRNRFADWEWIDPLR